MTKQRETNPSELQFENAKTTNAPRTEGRPRHSLPGTGFANSSVPQLWWDGTNAEDHVRVKRRGSLKNGNPSGDPHAAPRCGANTRAGSACQAPAMPNGVSTGPKTAEGRERIRKAVTKHGRYSAATKLRQEQYRQIVFGSHSTKRKLELLRRLREPPPAAS